MNMNVVCKSYGFPVLLALSAILVYWAPTAAQADACQSASYCVHDLMPLWSQMDGSAGAGSFNNSATPLLPYVNQQEGLSLTTDPGWCGAVSSAMTIKTLVRELSVGGHSLSSTFAWAADSNPSHVIVPTMHLVGTQIAAGGTSDQGVLDGFTSLANDISPQGFANPTVGYDKSFLDVTNFRSIKPFVQLHIHGTMGDHEVIVNGTDGGYLKIFDPWGSALNVSYAPTTSTLAYASTSTTFVSQSANFQNVQNGANTFLKSSTGAYAYECDSGQASACGNSFTAMESKVGSGVLVVSGTWLKNYSAFGPEAPQITQNPSSLVVVEGDSPTLSAAANGHPAPTYQWLFQAQNLAGATSPSLNLPNVRRTQAGSYSVVATNASGSVTSNAANLVVQYPPAFTTQPVSQTVTAGQSVTFSAAVDSNPASTFQWRLNGQPISGATSSTLTLNNVQLAQAGNYTVVATNQMVNDRTGSATSGTAVLTVQAAAAITSQPSSLNVNEGQSATFTVQASGNPAPTYQWLFNGHAITGATSATLTLTNVLRSQSGNYTVTVSNALGAVTSTAAALNVQYGPTITTQPQAVTVKEGQSASLSVQASGNPVPSYQWSFNGQALSGATSSTLTLNAIQRTQSGSYTVAVSNSVGSVTSAAAVVDVQFMPEFKVDLRSMAVSLGATVGLSVSVTGNPTPTITWIKDGATLSGSASTLLLSNLQTTNAGTYHVVLTNTVGTTTGKNATLAIDLPDAPGVSAAFQTDYLTRSSGLDLAFPGTGSVRVFNVH